MRGKADQGVCNRRRRAELELGWNRGVIRKGLVELEGNFAYLDNFRARGRKPAEAHLPHLLEDITAIAEAVSQTDPNFQTTQLYIRLSAAAVRKQLIEQKGYREEELPGEDTIGQKLNQLGYCLKKVKKSQPLKKTAETEAIFEQMAQVNAEADADETVLRLSVDAKGSVLLGLLSRGGYSRVGALSGSSRAARPNAMPASRTRPAVASAIPSFMCAIALPGASVIIRGIRAISDFEYEFKMAL